MQTYLIGDIQGCFDSLQALLKKIHFNADKDRLGFVGDLVNRGPKSLETLAFITQLENPLIVLGNHDLHFLALYFLGASKFHHIDHTLDALLHSPHCEKYVRFLLQKPFLYREHHFVMTHAGIPPQWSIADAETLSTEISSLLQKDPVAFFNHIYGNTPILWHDNLTEWDRARYIVNAFTRMRFCSAEGSLELNNKSDSTIDPDFKPWFLWRDPASDQCDIYFGHWAALRGQCAAPHIFALDTGCGWGEQLTAMEIHSHQRFYVDACE